MVTGARQARRAAQGRARRIGADGRVRRGHAVDIAGAQRDLQVVDRPPQQLAADRGLVAAVDLLAVIEIFDVAVIFAAAGADAIAQGLADRTRQADRAAILVIVGGQHIGQDAELGAGIAGGDVDQAGRGALAVEGALRTAQHFDALDVGKVGEGAGLERDRHVVQLDRDAGLDADAIGEGADAAQRHRGVDRLVGLANGQGRGDPRDVGEFLDAGAFQLPSGDDRNGQRHVLDVLGALLGGDDHFFQRDGVGCGLGEGRRGHRQQEHRRGRAAEQSLHGFPL
jgi:hypothetical protein